MEKVKTRIRMWAKNAWVSYQESTPIDVMQSKANVEMPVYFIKHHVIQIYGKMWIWLQVPFHQAIFYFLTVVSIKIRIYRM